MTGNNSVVLSLKTETLDRLTPCLSLVIEETADYLLTLSTSARLDPTNQNQCYDAFLNLQAETKRVVADICGNVESAFGAIGKPQIADIDNVPTEQLPELELLDLEVFEETLAIEKIVNASTERFWVDLESLMFRLGALLDTPASNIRLPVSPHLLCSAYRQALRDIEFPRNFLIDADSAFARKLLPELAEIYQYMNLYLNEHGLLPNIEEELNQTGSRLLISLGKRPTDLRQTAPEPSATNVDNLALADQTDSRDSRRLLHDTDWINALSIDIASSAVSAQPFNRETASVSPASPDQLLASGGKHSFVPLRIIPPSRDDAARNRLLQSTEQLLEQRPPPSLEMESECLRIARALAALRLEQTQSRFDYDALLSLIGFQPQPLIAERLREAHKITARLIDYLLQRLSPSEKQTPAFAHLEICFLELALIDPNFLIDGDHPGRVVVDRLTDLATLFPRADAKYLEGLVSVLIELTRKFDGTASTLAIASNTLSDLSLKLIKQQRQNRERLITRENARDKIDNARVMLIETLNAFFNHQPAKRGLIETITTVFADRWVVALLKGIPLTKIRGDIQILYGVASDANEPRTVEVTPMELASKIDVPSELTKEAKQALEALTQPSDEQMLAPENWGLQIDLTPAQLDNLLQNKPRLRRAAQSVQKLAVDTWFRHETPTGYRYLQIVWANRHGTRFVLTDERGLKQRDLSIIQLALEFDRSLKRLTTVERLSLVEQTLFSKLSAIQDDVSQRFSRLNKDSVNELTHELERALRRVRRSGDNIVIAAFTLPEDQPTQPVEKALADTNSTTGAVCRLSRSRVCLVGSFEPDALRSIVQDTYGITSDYEFFFKKLSDQDTSNINDLLDALNQTHHARKSALTESNDASSTPFLLEQAVAEAENQIAPLANKLRLRTIIRVPVADASNIETAFRVESLHNSTGSMVSEAAAQQRSLCIAANLIELHELCRLLRECEHQQRARPHLILRLHADTCLYAGAQDRILSLISEYAIGTSQLSFLMSDSLQLRESNTCQRLTRALRSIGCHIILDDYSPERVSDRSTELLNVSEIVIDATFWERAAQSEPWRSLLPQLIADTHHILGQAVSVRDPSITENIEHTGIDFIERESDVLLSTSELLRSLSSEFS